MRALMKLVRFIINLQGAVIVDIRIDRDRGAVVIRARRRSNAAACCSTCNRVMGGEHKLVLCTWRHLDLMRCRSYVEAEIRQGRCPVHGRRLERVPWAIPGAEHTRAFDEMVANLVQVADRSAAQRMFRVTWRTVGRMVSRVVGERLPAKRLDGLAALGVDEVSYKRGHRYLTVVSCLVSHRVLWVGEGKTAETLGRFFAELGPKRRKGIAVVAMDMSGGYVKAVRHWLPGADIVFDRFHIVQLLLKGIDEVRREEVRNLDEHERKQLKRTRFALLRNPRNRTPRDLDVIARVRATNSRLSRAYQRRTDFEDLWECNDEDEARAFLARWIRSALLSRIEPLRRVARTIREHIDGILGFFAYGGLTNAVLEGTNNKIKLLIHRAFGFRSTQALMSMIHLCCSGLVITVD
jgi:transposase